MYNYRVNTTRFNMVCGETANLLKLACGKIGQNGIRYPDGMEDTIVFSSNNAHDLIDAIKKGYWDHSTRSTRLQPGWTVYVIVNQNQAKELGSYIAIKAEAKTAHISTQELDETWTSSVEKDAEALLNKAIEVEGKGYNNEHC